MTDQDLLGYLRDAAQGASNSAASTVSGPVDLLAWLLRKGGVPVGEAPVMGSEWMAQKGLTAKPANALAGMAGETLGNISPIVAAAKAPQIANALLRAEQSIAPTVADMAERYMVKQGMIQPVMPMQQAATNEAARLARMTDQGYQRGFWRGGRSVADGQHYTPDAAAAVDFGRRVAGDSADVREYAIRLGNSLDFYKRYTAEQLKPLRDVLKNEYGSKYADQLLEVPGDFQGGAPGSAIYQIVNNLSGGNVNDALAKAGFDTVNAGQEVVTLHRAGIVRDAAKALFDPKKRFSHDPFAAIAGGAVGLNLLNQSLDRE